MMKTFSLAVTFFAIVVTMPFSYAQEDILEEIYIEPSGRVDAVSIISSYRGDLEPGAALWEWSYSAPDSWYLMIVFDGFDKDIISSGYFEILSDEDEVLETISLDSLDKDEPSVFLTGDYFGIRLLSKDSLPSGSFTVSKVIYNTDGGVVSNIIGVDGREHVNKITDKALLRASDAVAQLVYFKGISSFDCTGYLISKNLLVTNEHCISSQNVCRRASATFGRQRDANNVVRRGKSFRCQEVILSDYETDTTVLRLSGDPGNEFGWLEFASAGPRKDAQVYLVGHPGGQPKQISRKGCIVTEAVAYGRAAGTDFRHLCDTLTGSSGSPVLSESIKVVGHHHSGHKPDGLKSNRAVRVEEIIKVLARAGL